MDHYTGIPIRRVSVFKLGRTFVLFPRLTVDVNCFNLIIRLHSLPRFAETLCQGYCSATHCDCEISDYTVVRECYLLSLSSRVSLQTRTSVTRETTRVRQTPTAATPSGRTGASVTTGTRETASRATVSCTWGGSDYQTR